MVAEDILHFWFEELTPKDWFRKDDEQDRMIAQRFGAHHRAVRMGETWSWRTKPEGRLAEVIVLDQFSRNMFRGQAAAFANDGMALALAQEAVAHGDDEHLNKDQRKFLYMPFMHSESPLIHQQAVTLFEQLRNPDSLSYELKHQAIIDRFGRYPHRNALLGRTSTPEELEYLEQPGSAF